MAKGKGGGKRGEKRNSIIMTRVHTFEDSRSPYKKDKLKKKRERGGSGGRTVPRLLGPQRTQEAKKKKKGGKKAPETCRLSARVGEKGKRGRERELDLRPAHGKRRRRRRKKKQGEKGERREGGAKVFYMENLDLKQFAEREGKGGKGGGAKPCCPNFP